MDKWLKSKALAVAIEITNNTKNGGKTLEEFAKYTGRQGGEDVLYFIFKIIVKFFILWIIFINQILTIFFRP